MLKASLAIACMSMSVLSLAGQGLEIRIPMNRKGTTIQGTVGPAGVNYWMKVWKGERVTVTATSHTPGLAVFATVMLPDGKNAGGKGKPNFRGTIGRNGVLGIRVATNLMASTARGGAFSLRIQRS